MSASIFIKTWLGDLPWLPYCLRSIQKYASGFDEIVVVTDQSCYDVTLKIVDDSILLSVDDWSNGYIQQQWIKLIADRFTHSDYILFVDSDCIFHSNFSPASFMREDKPVLMKTKYGNLGGAEVWKGITEEFVGFEVNYEYMRRLPWMYKASSLSNFRNSYPHTEQHLKSLASRSFSEFNALGAYIDKYENDQYYITDTEVWMPESVGKQYWSWGGITPAIKTEIDNYLKVGAIC